MLMKVLKVLLDSLVFYLKQLLCVKTIRIVSSPHLCSDGLCAAKAQLSGTLVDEKSKTPIIGAVVSLEKASREPQPDPMADLFCKS